VHSATWPEISSPIGSETNKLSAWHSRRRLSSFDTPAPLGAVELLAAPLPLSKGRGGGGGGGGGGARGHACRLGTSGWCVGDPDPAVGVPATGLTNRHAALVESRQRGQNRRPQPCVVVERRDALG
jgi:hypothetical protein